MIIPVYNVENYIELCLSTVLKQSYKNLEVIIIDDGSSDQSGHSCEDLLLRDSRVKVIHQINKGAACAKNIGLDSVTGDYVAFIDSDDMVSDNWLETMVFALENNKAEISECCFDKVFITRTERMSVFSHGTQCFLAEEYLIFYLSDWTCSLFWNKIYKSEIIQNIRFHTERRCIDDEFFTYKVLSKAKRLVRINEVLYHYRQRLSGAVFSENHQRQITNDALDVLIERFHWIKQYYPKLSFVYYSHDIAIMNYFAHTFNFSEDTVKKFKRIRRYYISRVILYLSKQNVVNVIKLITVHSKKLLQYKPQNTVTDRENYFD